MKYSTLIFNVLLCHVRQFPLIDFMSVCNIYDQVFLLENLISFRYYSQNPVSFSEILISSVTPIPLAAKRQCPGLHTDCVMHSVLWSVGHGSLLPQASSSRTK